jgi:hypothetical protein
MKHKYFKYSAYIEGHFDHSTLKNGVLDYYLIDGGW